jgi:hypothetical protein
LILNRIDKWMDGWIDRYIGSWDGIPLLQCTPALLGEWTMFGRFIGE